tara:strand:+ start:163 stop:363 length:201 start_codon:yes stop_codon:yes gene_type:complete
MNLFERLKSEYKDKLETGNVNHPALTGYAVDQLELYEFIRDMPYGLVTDLRFLLDVDSPYELFKEI